MIKTIVLEEFHDISDFKSCSCSLDGKNKFFIDEI